MNENEFNKLRTIDDLIKHICPFCGRVIARKDTPYANYRGMLALHIKSKHPDIWRGFLDATMDAVRKNAYHILQQPTLETWSNALDGYDAKQLAGGWKLMQPIYVQLLREEPSPIRDDLIEKLKLLRDHVNQDDIIEYYKVKTRE